MKKTRIRFSGKPDHLDQWELAGDHKNWGTWRNKIKT